MTAPQLPAPPSPRINALNRPFWEGCRLGEIRLQRCMNEACARAIHYPRVCCPYCQGRKLEWFAASGTGRVISHTTIHRTHHDGFNYLVAYVFAAIELDEGPCLYGRLVSAPTAARLIGQRVRARFEPGGQAPPVAVFELIET